MECLFEKDKSKSAKRALKIGRTIGHAKNTQKMYSTQFSNLEKRATCRDMTDDSFRV